MQTQVFWQPAWPETGSVQMAWQHAEFGCMKEALLLYGNN